MSFIARHTFSLLSSVIFSAFISLVLWAYSKELDLLPPSQSFLNSEQTAAIQAYHTRQGVPYIAFTLARSLTKNPIKQIAFAILFSFKPHHTLLTTYAQQTQFGVVKGLSKAAPTYFGVSLQQLSIGETLLLLELAYHPALVITDPVTALAHRDALLNDLYRQKFFTSTQYQIERHKALALAADHRPIN